MRKLAREGEALVARTMHEAGFRPLKAIRRKAHVRKALAAAKAKVVYLLLRRPPRSPHPEMRISDDAAGS